VLVVHSVMQHRAILRGVAQQRAREARLRAAQQQEAA
ncbi:heme exporter protein CcmD, partial [Escherichia coli]|nr:heme exporter protein CcmD [Escherichia coli]